MLTICSRLNRSISRIVRCIAVGKPQGASMTKAAVMDTGPGLSLESMNSTVLNFDYAIRGPLMARALQLQADVKAGKTLPFPSVVLCNMGNPLAFGQKPLTFVRRVLSIMMYPDAINDKSMPLDVQDRARRYLSMVPSVGAYSESQGIFGIREDVAKFIHARDGYTSDPKMIFLTNGATESCKHILQCLVRDSSSGHKDGILLPIPQYPIYSAFIGFHNGVIIKYYLNEANQWSINASAIEASIKQARAAGVHVRGLVVINPGNPTGHVLSEDNQRQVIDICAKERVLLIADEVYQDNVWNPAKKFVSFKKVACSMGYKQDDYDSLQLISLHSAAKGFMGECGLRGGYCELFGISEPVRQQIYKLASISLCSNTIGQICVSLMVKPPVPSDPSYAEYKREVNVILSSLARRAGNVTKMMNSLEGVTCTNVDGAMYAFPRITLSANAVSSGKKLGMKGDEYYANCLLEETGIAIVHGSGFSQEEGTWHFRVTILPPEEVMNDVLLRWRAFHAKFVAKHK